MTKKLKLNQILAIEKGEKTRSQRSLTDLHKVSQKADLYNGFQKSFRATDEDGENYPDQKAPVQVNAEEVLANAQEALAELFDIEATKDWGNTEASADVTVEGNTLIEGAPVTYLLFLEKQLRDLRTFVSKIPILDHGENWTKDANSGLYRTDKQTTHKTKKVQKPIVLYEATEEHPAQTQLISEDVVVGHWDTVKFSGALPNPRKKELLARIDKLSKAVKQAREDGNMVDVEKKSVAEKVFGYLFT